MKTFLSLTFLACASIASAQNYAVTSAKITGGGGTSSGTGTAGNFSVTGAIGQYDTGAPSGGGTAAASGGAYAVSGGFFAQYMALQQTGAPPLGIRRGIGTNVRIVWAANVPGWVLQTNTTGLSTEGWADVAAAPTVDGAEQFHEFATVNGSVFFRLRKQ